MRVKAGFDTLLAELGATQAEKGTAGRAQAPERCSAKVIHRCVTAVREYPALNRIQCYWERLSPWLRPKEKRHSSLAIGANLPCARIEETKIPLHIMATNHQGQAVRLSGGP